MKEIMQKYLFLVITFAIMIVIIFALIILFNNKKKNRYSFYGLFIDMKNNEIFSLGLIIINFILLSFALIFKIKLNIAIIISSIILILLNNLIVFKFNKLPINIFINIVNLGIIYLANLINTLKISNESTMKYLILQIMVNVFGLFFFILTHLKFVKDLRKKANDEKIA